MKAKERNYFITGIVLFVAGILLIYKNSWGKYIDPWLSEHSRYKGHSSYWLVVAGIALILGGIILTLGSFNKMNSKNQAATK